MPAGAAELFRHVGTDKAALYRAVLDAFAAARRQYRLQLRPDEVLAEAAWPGGAAPGVDELGALLTSLVGWGNLEAQPDIARVTTLADYYRARLLYRLSAGGEAVEASLGHFAALMARRAELQSVALEDIAHRLQALAALLDDGSDDVPKLHETLRDLLRVFEGLADNAQAFMAGVARSLELQRAEEAAVAAYKKRLIGYLERFIGDLVQRSERIAQLVEALQGRIDAALWSVAEREARDAAPDDHGDHGDDDGDGGTGRADAQGQRWRDWRARWQGLAAWFVTGGAGQEQPPQAELLRSRARAAIPQLLAAVAAVNERRSGRSDRSADFRALAGWFAACADDDQAHRLARAAFALNPARHLALNPRSDDAEATTSWADAPPLLVHPRLRALGQASPRGPQPRARLRDAQRAQLAALMQEESRQLDAARRRLAQGRPLRLSELGALDEAEFGLFLGLLGDALAEQHGPDEAVERDSGDGQFHLRLQPLGADSHATVDTPQGRFSGRDHDLTITPAH
ncbi:MAG: TIGR02677 family protein [Proteobacteria bacterium]|nr:TIGR02677 family protein [Pseudomonadota bacterium]